MNTLQPIHKQQLDPLKVNHTYPEQTINSQLNQQEIHYHQKSVLLKQIQQIQHPTMTERISTK